MSHTFQSLSRRTVLPKCKCLEQVRHATLIRRPKRPYTFTQLVTLTDGSTFLHRTTSPLPVYRSTKDARNSPLWNPSSQKLLNIEEDEAGKLRSFRNKFGRGWDAEAVEYTDEAQSGDEGSPREKRDERDDSLLDLIADYKANATGSNEATGDNQSTKKSDTSKNGS